MNDIQIVENFLPKYQLQKFLSIFDDKNLCWNYVRNVDRYTDKFKENDSAITSYDQFVKNLDNNKHSYWYKAITKNIASHFNISNIDITRMRLVFSIPRPTLINYSYGTPHVDSLKPHKTLIFYGNDSDCKTVLFKEFYEGHFDFSKKSIETMVEPKQGRALLFNGLRYHSVQPHSQNNRLLLNVNFIEKAP
jgi:hypothetical protein